jgi:shikimate dehydrogenase
MLSLVAEGDSTADRLRGPRREDDPMTDLAGTGSPAFSRVSEVLTYANDSHGALRTGLIGASIKASLSPALHEREGRLLGLGNSYRLIDLDALGLSAADLPAILAACKAAGLAGVNVTHPVKQAILPVLDDLSKDARLLGAVNTVVFRNGRAIGHNTDWFGFAEAFRRTMTGVKCTSVVQLGAGGAGAAVAHALLSAGAERLWVADTDKDRASALCDTLNRNWGPDRAGVTADAVAQFATADGLVNCTPVGMAKYPGLPIDASALRPDLWVADIVYFPLETALLAEARRLGCRTMGGGGMVVFQAAEALRLFSGAIPDTARMLAHFDTLSGKPE